MVATTIRVNSNYVSLLITPSASATRTRTIPAESESWAESQCSILGIRHFSSSQFLHRYRHLILEDTQTLIQRITHRGVWGTTAAAAAAPTPGRDISSSGGYQAFYVGVIPSEQTSWRRYLEPEQAISADMHGTTMFYEQCSPYLF
ncbi:hypothetical protein Moror_13316 [Moniliophthora roreri MCA 2997]|uniref:Uncharacterized protein n=1 Tax=Moniliophthora roreri (strain MCA 2997) TaxID=1381753 RepID=V2WWT6_MONRO|nr:hypothetical protein Moror_13316 [Moniliophthora roreri MCA 2997]